MNFLFFFNFVKKKNKAFMSNQLKNCVFLGNNGIGKTSLIMTFHQHSFPANENLIPNVFERFNTNIMVNGKEIPVQIIDSDDEEIESNRKAVAQAHVAVICFSLISPKSYEDVETRWMKMIKKENSKIPHILVGTKADLRDDFESNGKELAKKGFEPISTNKGNELKQRIGACSYVECSAKCQINFDEAFHDAAQAAFHHKDSHCNVF